MRWAYRRLKTNMKEHLTKHVVSIYAYVKMQKNRKSNDKEDGDKQKKARLIIDNEKQNPFQFVSIWL